MARGKHGSPKAARFASALRDGGSRRVTEAEVRTLLAERRTREAVLGGELFADPAWDMLLELYASYLGRRVISTSELVSALAVPPTTALSWIDKLESIGLADRTPDPKDRRRVCVEVSNDGLAKMRSYFAAVRSRIWLT